MAATVCPAPRKLTFDLLTLKVVSKSSVTWVTSVPILVFPGLSVLNLGSMYTTDRRCQMSDADAHHRLLILKWGSKVIQGYALPYMGRGITIVFANSICQLLQCFDNVG